MDYSGDPVQHSAPVPPAMRHYHGDVARVLFVSTAVIMLLAETLGATLPFNAFGTVVFAVALVIAAGITNPEQMWINYLNILLAVLGALTFGPAAVGRFQSTQTVFDITFFATEILALLFLLAIYFTVKTVRGIMLRPHLT